MALFKPPALDKAAPIVDSTGRITPYFQRFWQNLSFTAAAGAEGAFDYGPQITTINGQITTINTALGTKLNTSTFTAFQTTNTAAIALKVDAATYTAGLALKVNTSTYTAGLATKVDKGVVTGWANPTGTAARAAFATYAAPTISNPPTQAEVQAIADHLQVVSRTLKAVIDDLKTLQAFNT